ncbi:MAG TPA: T9SS type A sorting domain-containing protein, partial [Hymenobacter sp.]
TATVVGTCASAGLTYNVVAPRTVVPPTVGSPIVSGATSVSGTSSEATGSTITLTTYSTTDASGTALASYTATVLSNGTWSVTVPALTSGSVKATVSTADYGTSGFSNVVPVQPRTASVPVITGTYSERGTSVAGTSAAAVGSTITVYEDGDVIGTATVVAGGTWTLTGLSNASGVSPNTSFPTLYAGGVLTATATTGTSLPSAASAPVTVGCVSLADKSFSASAVCPNNAAAFTVANAEPGVVYTLQDATSGSNVTTGVPRVGTGSGTSSLVISTSVYTTPGTYSIKLNAFSVGAINCSQTTTASAPATVNPQPVDKAVGAAPTTVGPSNTGTNITVAASEVGVSYQLRNVSATPNSNVGPAKAGTGSTLALPTGPITAATTYAVAAVTTNSCTRTLSQTQTISYNPLPVELAAFTAEAKNGDALLRWSTASERNNDHFAVERSLDSRNFTWLGQVAGHGTSTRPQAYTFTDAGSARFGGWVYYRLRQVDSDGTESFSPVRAVQFLGSELPAKMLLYPNPTSQTITLSLALLPAGTYTVGVLNLTGQTLLTARLAGGQAHDLDVASLPAGAYVVRLQSATLSQTQRLIKLR